MTTNGNIMKNIYLYARFERLWHWLQTLLIIILLLTGFEVNGAFTLFGFETAVEVHNFVGLTWLIAFAFFVFWIMTTGEWKQYIPTTKKMFSVVRYYMYGIFRGEAHPVPKRKEAKHNPLQRIVYLILAALAGVNMVSGAGMMDFESCQSYEKLVIDAEMLQMMSEVMTPLEVSDAAIGLEAIREVGPGGHVAVAVEPAEAVVRA